MRRMLVVVAMLLGSFVALQAQAACPPEGQSRESLEALKTAKFAMDDAAARQKLALGLVDCLGDPDPALRDGLAYEALSHWMRAGELNEATLRTLRDRLYAGLKEDDPEGFRHPFSALVLSEVARTDRVKPWMSPKERNKMVDVATKFLSSVDDYRGFDNHDGWRHSVAHGSDWLLQLALIPSLNGKQLDRILDAVAVQVVPEKAHAYVFGEPGRLARPVLAIAKRGMYTPAQWESWLTALTPKLGDEKLAYNDEAWLARRHDLLAFLTALYLEADRSDDAALQALEPPIVSALKTVP